MVQTPTNKPESAYSQVRNYCLMMTAYHSVQHQTRLKEKGMYEVAKKHRLLFEIYALGRKRMDLLEEADQVLRRVDRQEAKCRSIRRSSRTSARRRARSK